MTEAGAGTPPARSDRGVRALPAIPRRGVPINRYL